MNKSTTNLRKVIIENSDGLAVRVFLTSEKNLTVVMNTETNRIELVSSLASLGESAPQYKEMGTLNGRQSLQVANGYIVRSVENVTDFTEGPALSPEEDDDRLLKLLRLSAIAHITLLCLFLGTWFVYDTWLNPETPVEVVVLPPLERKELPKVKKRTKTVTAKRNIVKPRRTVKVSKTKVSKTRTKVAGLNAKSKHKSGTGKRGRPNVNIKNSQLFDTLSKYNRAQGKSGGLNLANDPSTANAGWGRGAKSGVHSTTGQGLVLGPGNPGGGGGGGAGSGAGTGATGYNTRGQAAGNNGFGNISMKGSAKFSVDALEGEALIEEGGGGLSSDQIDAVIRRNLGQVRACYERGLQKSPALQGRVSVSFVIGSSGRVSTSRVSHSSLKNGSVESCINSRLKGWKFPRPSGNVDVKVSYPFVLGRVSRG